jgi:hypothetical protein
MIVTGTKAMTKGAAPARRVEIFTGAGRRRVWSDEDRGAIVAESYAGFDSVSGVARRHGLPPAQSGCLATGGAKDVYTTYDVLGRIASNASGHFRKVFRGGQVAGL